MIQKAFITQWGTVVPFSVGNGTITFTGNGQENQKKKYLNRVTAVLLMTHNEALFIISLSCIS